MTFNNTGKHSDGRRCLPPWTGPSPADLLFGRASLSTTIIDMDTFLKLPSWTGTIVSKGDPIPEDQRPKSRVASPLPEGSKIPKLTDAQKAVEKADPKIAAIRERKEQQNLARAEARRARTGGSDVGGARKKRRVLKDKQPTQSGSVETRSPSPINHAGPDVTKKPIVLTEVAITGADAEKEVVNLSGNTRDSPPPVNIVRITPSPERTRHDSPRPTDHSPQSSHHGNDDLVNKFVPNWQLRNDLRVCTFGACKELLNHLATPAEDDFLSTLSNAELSSRAYQMLGQSTVTQAEVLKRYGQLNHENIELLHSRDVDAVELARLRSEVLRTRQDNEDLSKQLTLVQNAHADSSSREKEMEDRVKELEKERDDWRGTAAEQVERIRCLENDLEPRNRQLMAAEEKVKVLESEKVDLVGKVSSAEVERKKLIRDFVPLVVKKLHQSIEYRKSLAEPVQLCYTAGWLGGLALGRTEEEIGRILSEAKDLDIEGSKHWEEKHRELFTMSYPFVNKIAASSDLPLSELFRVSPDVPPPSGGGNTSKAGAEVATTDPSTDGAGQVNFGTTT